MDSFQHEFFLFIQRVPKLQAQDQAVWWDTLGKMQKLLRKAAHMCFINESMTADEMHNYFMSGNYYIRLSTHV